MTFRREKPVHCNRAAVLRYLVFVAWTVIFLSLSGCSGVLKSMHKGTLLPQEGKLAVQGLNHPVTVRRDDRGIPFIEAKDLYDLAFAIGYINAADRLNQMISLKLLSQGRLSEMAGPPMLDIDRYMRTMNLKKAGELIFDEMSKDNKDQVVRYAQGVNAYMEQYKDRLPPELSLNGYTPEKWDALDSMSVMAFIGMSLAFNMHEEVGSLAIAQAVGARNAAWLLPVYPDEPIPLSEADKLEGVELKGALGSLQGINAASGALASLGLSAVASSNNWAISKDKTLNKASICANDAHLFLSLPSAWNMMHIRCDDLDVAGFGMVGIPCIISGYNGKIAWGQTMVMADNQDIYLERLKVLDGKLHYLHKGTWKKADVRHETIAVRGCDPVQFTVYETIHGPMLNDVLKGPSINPLLMPDPVELPLGMALSWAAVGRGDKSGDVYFDLSRAKSVQEALVHIRKLQAIPLNIVVADRDNIAWQVTGNYPVRKKGRGLMPSPGWTGEYDWEGYLDASELPCAINPPEGFLATANNRTVSRDYPHTLSSSWYWPDRVDRIREMITTSPAHTLKTNMDMQLDNHSVAVAKIKDVLMKGELALCIGKEIDSWPDGSMQEQAREALSMLRDFDGNMTAGSKNALIVGALMHALTRDIFLDELGPVGSPSWNGFIASNMISYSATTDHLLVRGDESPFWDDVKTPVKETKAMTIARCLSHAVRYLEQELGRDRSKWDWGALHSYRFRTESSKMAPHLGFVAKTGMKVLDSFFNRGPFPASGDHTTLNVSAYVMGKDFDTWLIPSMRMVADFSLEEPFYAVNSTGQSDNPASPHYDDAIYDWLKGEYRSMPFTKENIERQYRRVLVLSPEDQGK